MIVIGTDTHKRTHTCGAVFAGTGQLAGELTAAAREPGFRELLDWGRDIDEERIWAIEDCRHVSGSFERFLVATGERVVRVPPKLMGQSRRGERTAGKSDPIDAPAVEIFDDRIEISSPGRFPGLVDLGDPLKATRFARIPRIARVCSDLNFGQELGEGIRRIFEEMRHAGLTDPIYRQTAGSVELKLLAEPVDRRLEAGLPESTRAITAALRTAGRLSTGEVKDILGVSRPVAQRELSALKEAGVIEWMGKSPKDPRAYWRLRTR